MFDLIKYKNWFIGLSVFLVIAAISSIYVYGFKEGIDFKGGTLWQIKFTEQGVAPQELEAYLKTNFSAENLLITAGSEEGVLMIRTNEISEEQHQTYIAGLQQNFGTVEELRFESVGPTIGAELRSKAIWAFILALTGISLYIAFAFRKVSFPVSSWKYGFSTLLGLFHNTVIAAGFFAWWSHVHGLEIDTNFLVAILTIMGFSVHDTIVVFDRIRENLIVQRSKKMGEIINISINQTFARSINTSLTLAIVLIAVYLFGAATLSHFVLLILVGTVVGTYSSIFVASPLLTYLQSK